MHIFKSVIQASNEWFDLETKEDKKWMYGYLGFMSVAAAYLVLTFIF